MCLFLSGVSLCQVVPSRRASWTSVFLNFPIFLFLFFFLIFFSIVACTGNQEFNHLEKSQCFSSCYFCPVCVRVSFGNDSVPTVSKNKDYPEE